MVNAINPCENNPDAHDFRLENFDFAEVDDTFIQYFSLDPKYNFRYRDECDYSRLEVNNAVLYNTSSYWDDSTVQVEFVQNEKILFMSCSCRNLKKKMCKHQASALNIIRSNDNFRLFFDVDFRREKFLKLAKNYGLEEESNLDNYFELKKEYRSAYVVLKRKDILPIDQESLDKLLIDLIPSKNQLPENLLVTGSTEKALVFSQSRYSDNFFIYYFSANTTKDGNIKNPLHEISALTEIDTCENLEGIKFFSSISLFKDRYENNTKIADKIKALKSIAKNPLNLKLYYHDTKISDKINVKSIREIKIVLSKHTYLSLQINEVDNFYEILAYLHFDNRKKINLRRFNLLYGFIFMFEGDFHVVENLYYVKMYKFFKEHNYKISIHKSKFEEFKSNFLEKVEGQVELNYSFVKSASKKQIKEKKFDLEPKRTIYLDESDSYIFITPSIRYGEIEIPILSLKTITDFDVDGKLFSFERDKFLENNFAGLLLRQHPSFEEQLGQFDYFYLHRQDFLESGWFIDAFETWKENDVEVLGFNKIKNNQISAQKIKVSILVSTGIDWFESSLKVKFGNEEISLNSIQKSIKNRQKFVKLGDGTEGLMPEEWIEKFSKYFRSGELVDGKIRTSKINFSQIDDLYEEEVLTKETKFQLELYKEKLENFKSIKKIKIPKTLKAELRSYQKEGVNWLNFLDEFNFGGCLADDMGLGKTVQVLAFLLRQKEIHKNAVNLIVLPTSLVFNWQREIEKFAPSLKFKVHYGSNRDKKNIDFLNCDVLMTTYGTLLSDVKLLKSVEFNYIILDESQAIKNPDSQRFKSVRLLSSRNKLVLTGTPIENNTFDLYAQMSFVNPGIFVSKERFREEYSTPIDKFNDSARAKELQAKISPFILRRTKKQVAKELPEKTEMVLFCEMEQEQRAVYDTFKNQIRDMLLNPNSTDKPENKSMLILSGLTKLRQICNSPAILNEDADYGNASAKLKVLLEEIQTKSANHKILVFSQFVSMLDLIRAELDRLEISHEYLTGQTTNREEKVHSFQNDVEIRVFLISLKAGGTGLNLTEADYVYLVDPWWNPAVENQAIDRCYRIGQNKKVVAIRLISPNTIEEKIMQLQDGKKELADELIKTDVNVLKSLDKDQLLNLFS